MAERSLDELAIEEQAPEVKAEDALPEKYQGKSLKDVVRMHQEAEKAIGKQSGEVGELRKLVDDFITKQTELTVKKEPAEKVDFFVDPETAVRNTVENMPELQELRQLTVKQKQNVSQTEILRRHPDAMNMIQDAKFIEWVTASKIRQSLLVKADKEYDVDAADELFNLWKDRQSLVSQATNNAKDDRKASVNKASTGMTSSADSTATKKKYRRADIIKLMQTDPKRYESLASEIRQAYADGRVI